MYTNHINRIGANIDKSYIIKSKDSLEKYISKTKDGKFLPSQLIKATVFENREDAEKIANMLKQDGYQIEVMEIQNRTRW